MVLQKDEINNVVEPLAGQWSNLSYSNAVVNIDGITTVAIATVQGIHIVFNIVPDRVHTLLVKPKYIADLATVTFVLGNEGRGY